MGDGLTEGRGTIGGVRVSKKFSEGGMGVMQQKVLADLKNHKCLCNNPAYCTAKSVQTIKAQKIINQRPSQILAKNRTKQLGVRQRVNLFVCVMYLRISVTIHCQYRLTAMSVEQNEKKLLFNSEFRLSHFSMFFQARRIPYGRKN